MQHLSLENGQLITRSDRSAAWIGAPAANGGAGCDVFDYDHLTEAGDTITGFVLGAAGDVLDMADLLDEIGYAGSDAVGEGYIVFGQAGTNTIVSVDIDGSSSGASNTATLVTSSMSLCPVPTWTITWFDGPYSTGTHFGSKGVFQARGRHDRLGSNSGPCLTSLESRLSATTGLRQSLCATAT
jgi:hypothetical protein